MSRTNKERKYVQRIETCAVEVLEHIDMARRVTGVVQLQQDIITEERMTRRLRKMKSK